MELPISVISQQSIKIYKIGDATAVKQLAKLDHP